MIIVSSFISFPVSYKSEWNQNKERNWTATASSRILSCTNQVSKKWKLNCHWL